MKKKPVVLMCVCAHVQGIVIRGSALSYWELFTSYGSEGLKAVKAGSVDILLRMLVLLIVLYLATTLDACTTPFGHGFKLPLFPSSIPPYPLSWSMKRGLE